MFLPDFRHCSKYHYYQVALTRMEVVSLLKVKLGNLSLLQYLSLFDGCLYGYSELISFSIEQLQKSVAVKVHLSFLFKPFLDLSLET